MKNSNKKQKIQDLAQLMKEKAVEVNRIIKSRKQTKQQSQGMGSQHRMPGTP